MVKDAEAHADEDKQKQELIEVRNQADTLVYTSEKSLRDLGDKVDAELKADIETKIEALKKALEKLMTPTISRPSPTTWRKVLPQAGRTAVRPAERGPGSARSRTWAHPAATPVPTPVRAKDDDDVVDADYTEVK